MESNLNLYYIFYTVARCKNISAAAKELYISQLQSQKLFPNWRPIYLPLCLSEIQEG